ncbi:PQQ-dependent sugar dehydrogenase [Alteromonas oceanisediminis]|uniref:PQQ-dependent sugar dehydrogenase n=1 Tax=Alteromonas oceanisediminis TaxID=2836180 RepID=UPI001BDA1FC9|nr:PQQ-dependent sugar dehydrogenase [Alteromonas oceanisediminis]MBT0586146.1 PQQ-dependent sugar dehydrogenase [Alteromonas oceanisediminis]
MHTATLGSLIFIASVSLGLSACGGGSDDNDSPPAPPPAENQAPSFTSASETTIAEEQTGSVFQFTAEDADGDTLSFSIVGGEDADLFELSSSGALTTATPINFERPLDTDRDNIYAITVQVSDGTANSEQDVLLTVTDEPEAYQLSRVAEGFAAPLFLTGRPGHDDVFVTERAGVVQLLDPNTGERRGSAFLDISATIGTAGEGGLIGFAPAPDYETSGNVYVHVTNVEGNTEIRRYTRSDVDPDSADPTTEDIIFTAEQPASNHNGGWIGFGQDGFLYIALGDGGGAGDPFENAQDLHTVLGAMLRIDVSQDDFPDNPDKDYAIPLDNPFSASTDGNNAGEIFAYGLRNPFRAAFDRQTGDLYIGDVGQNAIEEVSRIDSGETGQNFGWPILEGTAIYDGGNTDMLLAPVIEYSHGEGQREGRSITGGYVYRGSISELQGRYFFADFVSDNIWSLPVDDLESGQTISGQDFVFETQSLTPDEGTLTNIVSFGEDNAGELYVLSINGDIFKILPN